MPCSFSYDGTSPATVVNFPTPQMGEWKFTQKWMSPKIKAAGGEDAFVFDKAIVRVIQSLHWGMLGATVLNSLLLFIAVVDGISKCFDYIDPAGDSWKVRIWNAAEIEESLVSFGKTDITIDLFVEAKWYYLTDYSSNHITDNSGNQILVAARL